jgi:hypothetical protein
MLATIAKSAVAATARGPRCLEIKLRKLLSIFILRLPIVLPVLRYFQDHGGSFIGLAGNRDFSSENQGPL